MTGCCRAAACRRWSARRPGQRVLRGPGRARVRPLGIWAHRADPRRGLSRRVFDIIVKLPLSPRAGEVRRPVARPRQFRAFLWAGPAALFDLPWIPFYLLSVSRSTGCWRRGPDRRGDPQHLTWLGERATLRDGRAYGLTTAERWWSGRARPAAMPRCCCAMGMTTTVGKIWAARNAASRIAGAQGSDASASIPRPGRSSKVLRFLSVGRPGARRRADHPGTRHGRLIIAAFDPGGARARRRWNWRSPTGAASRNRTPGVRGGWTAPARSRTRAPTRRG